MNFSERSSRVTGPKMRVPIGSCLLFSSTAALPSKRISEPSGRRTPVTGADHDGVVDLALLDLAARNRFLDGDLDDVADAGVTALGAAQHLDAHHSFGAAVVRDVEVALNLDHDLGSPYLTPLRVDDFDHAPVLGLGQRTALGHADDVAVVARVVLVVRVQLGRTADVLAVQRRA